MTFNRTLMACLLCASSASTASATLINFDAQGLTGPSVFASASPSPQTLNIATVDGNVTFEGGVILNNTANLPADQTALYGTADFGRGLSNPITITFANNITNFFLDVFNGQVSTATFRVADNIGNFSDFSLPSNLSSGQTTIGFAAAGNVVTIQDLSSGGSFDFFIDNVNFNAPLPPSLATAPEPGPFVLMAAGLAGLALMARRVRNT